MLLLWDTYLSADEGFHLHPYVCLGNIASLSPSLTHCAAVLDKCKDDLEELEQTDLRGYLQALPWVDVNEVPV